MLHVPFRGGVRGGKDQFTWDSVKTDKDRECYLGHSIKAPVGRWQKGKDIHWYANENSLQTKNSKNEEFQKAKNMEEKALMAALGYKVVDKPKEIEIKKERSESESDLEEEEIKRDSRNKKHKKNKSKVSGPSTLSSSDKKNLDTMLKKLVIKNGLDAVLKALIVESSDEDDNDEHGSSKKKSKKEEKNNKSKKSKKKESSTDDDSSQDERFKKKKNRKYSSDDDDDESSDDTRKKHNDLKRKRSRDRERDYNSKRYNR